MTYAGLTVYSPALSTKAGGFRPAAGPVRLSRVRWLLPPAITTQQQRFKLSLSHNMYVLACVWPGHLADVNDIC